MKYLSKRVYSLFFVCCFCSVFLYCCHAPIKTTPPTATTDIGALDFLISLDKPSYKLDEPIQVVFSLKNIGTNEVIINRRFALNTLAAPKELIDIYCIVIESSGQEIRFTASVSVKQLSSKDYIELNPGEITDVVYNDLMDFYGFTKPGEYTIQAVYENWSDSDAGVTWKGKIYSNVVSFTIEP